MYFANVAFIRDKLKELVFTFYKDAPEAHRVSTLTSLLQAGGSSCPFSHSVSERCTDQLTQRTPPPLQCVRYIVIECTAVISLDSTAIHMLESLHRDFKERGIRVAFATVGNRMDKDLRRAGLKDKIGSRWFHPSVHACLLYTSPSPRD